SRSLILQLRPLTADDIRTVVARAIEDSRGLGGRVDVTPEAVDLLVQLAAGDARRALTALEVAAEATEQVGVEAIEQSLDRAAVRYDRDGDQHYDVVSAFIKSVRGSDVDAALHYLARMLIRGVRLYGEGERVDVLVDDGQIAEIAAELAIPDTADVIDATGHVLLPGLVDLHTHLREPGREYAEDIETGSAAAALGGYTAVFAMANTHPVADSPVVTDHVWRRGQ
ncbi:hypothetical protein B1T47_02545, partial [Mycobacterium kansasii]